MPTLNARHIVKYTKPFIVCLTIWRWNQWNDYLHEITAKSQLLETMHLEYGRSMSDSKLFIELLMFIIDVRQAIL